MSDLDIQAEQALFIIEHGKFDYMLDDELAMFTLEYGEFDMYMYSDSFKVLERQMYRKFFINCRLGNVDGLKVSNCSLNQSQLSLAAIYAAKYKQREVYIFLLQTASDHKWNRLETLRDLSLIATADYFSRKNDLETIEWLVSLNLADATLICNEVLYSAARNKNVPLEDWVLNKYVHYVDVTHENHRTLKSVIFPMHHESIERLCEEYIKLGKEKISFEVIIDDAIKHKHVGLLRLVIENWAEGFDIREMKVNSKMDQACREYLMSVIELQNAVGIEKWKESVKTKEEMDLKPKRTKLF